MQIPQLIIVRHGETSWSASGKHTSHTDIGLTDDGRAEAQRLREWLHAQKPARVWSSPLKRARETAVECGFADAQTVDGLREWDYGAYEGMTTPQIQQEVPDWNLFHDGAGEGGETPQQVQQRVDAVIDKVRATPDSPVIAFAHGHVLRALAARWTAQPIALGARLILGSGTVSVLHVEHGLGAISVWNARHPD